MKDELPEANWKEKAAFLLGYREAFLIEGDSMLPTLKNGDFILIDPKAEPQATKIVLARHPFLQSVTIVKRIHEITPEGKFFLIGDNLHESNDSRTFGAIQARDILGIAVSQLKDKIMLGLMKQKQQL